jgi:hypothetical protein
MGEGVLHPFLSVFIPRCHFLCGILCLTFLQALDLDYWNLMHELDGLLLWCSLAFIAPKVFDKILVTWISGFIWWLQYVISCHITVGFILPPFQIIRPSAVYRLSGASNGERNLGHRSYHSLQEIPLYMTVYHDLLTNHRRIWSSVTVQPKVIDIWRLVKYIVMVGRHGSFWHCIVNVWQDQWGRSHILHPACHWYERPRGSYVSCWLEGGTTCQWGSTTRNTPLYLFCLYKIVGKR